MPNRILRDWTDSDRFDGLSPEAERLFVRLLMKADDYGRFHAEARRLKAALFPLVEDIRQNDITAWLKELAARDLVLLYEVLDNRQLLSIVKFRQRLKQSVPKFPAPTGEPETWIPPDSGRVPETSRKSPPYTETETEAHSETRIGDGDGGASADAFCEEAALPLPAEPPVLIFPCVGTGGKDWGLSQVKIDEYALSFPGFDILTQARAARQWCIDNPTKRKTVSGMPKFLTGWFTRRQNEGGFNGNGSTAHRGTSPTFADARRASERAREYHDPATDVA